MAAIAALLCGCEGAPQDVPQDVPLSDLRQSSFSDAELRAAAYSDSSPPEWMYSDPYSPLYYENTVSTGQSDDEWRELCTDDRDQARAWAGTHTLPDDLGERVDQKFFEFTRRDHSGAQPIYHRVHRCTYVDLYEYDHFNRTPQRGAFNHRPLTAEDVRELGEYLWYLRYYDISGFRVLSSFGDDDAEGLRHTLYYVTVVGGDFGLCDKIGLRRRVSTVDRVTGAIEENEEGIRVIDGYCH